MKLRKSLIASRSCHWARLSKISAQAHPASTGYIPTFPSTDLKLHPPYKPRACRLCGIIEVTWSTQACNTAFQPWLLVRLQRKRKAAKESNRCRVHKYSRKDRKARVASLLSREWLQNKVRGLRWQHIDHWSCHPILTIRKTLRAHMASSHWLASAMPRITNHSTGPALKAAQSGEFKSTSGVTPAGSGL